MLHPKLKTSIVIGMGLLAPLWWTWSISNLIYAFYVAAGGPTNPHPAFMHASLFLPSLLLGLAIGLLVASLSPNHPIGSWLLFWVALLASTVVLDFVFNESALAIIELFRSPSNFSFLIASILLPIYKCFRTPTAVVANAKFNQ